MEGLMEASWVICRQSKEGSLRVSGVMCLQEWAALSHSVTGWEQPMRNLVGIISRGPQQTMFPMRYICMATTSFVHFYYLFIQQVYTEHLKWLGVILGTGDLLMSKTEKVPAFTKLTVQWPDYQLPIGLSQVLYLSLRNLLIIYSLTFVQSFPIFSLS